MAVYCNRELGNSCVSLEEEHRPLSAEALVAWSKDAFILKGARNLPKIGSLLAVVPGWIGPRQKIRDRNNPTEPARLI